jgi:hypothetical protein
MLTVDVLAQNNFGDTRTGGLAGPLGLLIVLLMAIATVLLIRNMNARLRRLPDRFPSQDEPAPGAAGISSEPAAGSADRPAVPGQQSRPARTTRPEPPGVADNAP